MNFTPFAILSLLFLSSAAHADECGFVTGNEWGAVATCKVCLDKDEHGNFVWNIYATDKSGLDNGIVIYQSDAFDRGSTIDVSWGHMSLDLVSQLKRAVGTAGNLGLCGRDTAGPNSEKELAAGNLPGKLPRVRYEKPKREHP